MTLQETGFYDGPSCWRVFRPVWRPCCFTGHRYASSFLRSCQRRRNRFPDGSTDFRLPGRTGCSGVPLQNVLLPESNSFCFAFPFLSVVHFAGNLGFRFFFGGNVPSDRLKNGWRGVVLRQAFGEAMTLTGYPDDVRFFRFHDPAGDFRRNVMQGMANVFFACYSGIWSLCDPSYRREKVCR